MHDADEAGASAAARDVVTGQGFAAEDIAVLQRSNRLTALIAPCDVVARVAPVAKRSVAELEVEVAAALVVAGAPVAPPDPRFEPKAFESGRFVVTLWTYCHPTPGLVDARVYARALARLHESMRELDSSGLTTGRYTDRVDQALRAVEGSANPFDLSDVDRALVANTVRNSSRSVLGSGAPEQLLHGEPHSGNLLRTDAGPLFVDLETCCRGPVEFDIAHATTVDGGPPLAVAKAYPGADVELVRDCWRLALGLATAWRFESGDDLPDGRARALEWIRLLRNDADRG